MEADNDDNPIYAFDFRAPDDAFTTSFRLVDDALAIDYARRKLRELHAEKGFTTVAVVRGVGDDLEFVGAWERTDVGSMVSVGRTRVALSRVARRSG